MELSFYLTRSAALKRALFPGDEGSSLKKEKQKLGGRRRRGGGSEGERRGTPYEKAGDAGRNI